MKQVNMLSNVLSKCLPIKNYRGTIHGTVAHCDTTNVTFIQSMEILRTIPPHTIVILQWRLTDNYRFTFVSETMQATAVNKPKNMTYYTAPKPSRRV